MVMSFIAKLWTDVLRPMLRRPQSRQVAALCWREKKGRRQVLMVTARGSGRWVIPKGWPIKGLTNPEAALTEAWEEAGVRADIIQTPIGSYGYKKKLGGGMQQPIRVDVYAARVIALADTWPECAERRRKWVYADKAAHKVREAELKILLRAFAKG